MESEMNESQSSIATVLTEFPDEKYRTALTDIIKSNFNSPIDELSVKIDAGSGKGDNYIGVLHRVSAEDQKGKKINIIVKLPPTNLARREQFSAGPCFLRESEFYDDVYPLYKKFQEEKGIVVEKDGFYEVPGCYTSLSEDLHEGLFLEDLKVSGFEMFDRLSEVKLEHVNRVMEALGKFHAICFALKDQKPEALDPYRDMRDIFFHRDNMSNLRIRTMFELLKKQSIDALNTSDNRDLIEKTNKFLEGDFFELLMACIDGKAAEPHSIITHGDCWNNNIMYRYESDIPVEVRLLDFQSMRYSSPVCDLVYYIFSGTTKDLRDKHYNDFLDTYYNSLSSFMKRLGSNPENVFPREIFDDHLIRFGKFGLLQAIMVLPVFLSKAEDAPDMDQMAEEFKEKQENGIEVNTEEMKFTSAETLGAYNERMVGVFEDIFNLGYI